MLAPALLLLAAFLPPGTVIDHHPASTRQYIGSPSIAILPNGEYVASHDFFGPGSSQSTSAVTRIFRSRDRGQSWSKTAEFQDQFWSNLFVHRGALYLMGTTFEYGRIVIRQSRDGGLTWSGPSALTPETGYHTAPVPVVEHKGRLWRAFEYHPAGKWGFFEALVVSAPSRANLLDPKSWTLSARLPFAASEGKHWLEGNIVKTPANSLVDILRLDDLEKAAILKVSADKLSFDSVVDFPGGAKKFTIRPDSKTRRYWTLSNAAPPGAANPASIRNTLVLMSSPDLRHWTVDRTVLSHPDVQRHAFQYVDWQFDGADIIAAARTAFDDDEGGAPRGHDANYLTFHRIRNFRVNEPAQPASH
jgi:hypothetical protein